MNRFDFITNMTQRFGGKKETYKAQYTDDLNKFCDKCDVGNLDDIFRYATNLDGYPDYKAMFSYAKNHDYLEGEESSSEDNPMYYNCRGISVVRIEEDEDTGYKTKYFDHIDCNTQYTTNSTGCPNCHSTNSERVISKDNTLPKFVLKVQEDCHRCKEYSLEHSENRDNNVHGPKCDNYGKFGYPNKTCGTCKCNLCCKACEDFSAHPRKHIEGIQANGNKLPSWIRTSLSQGVHRRDEKRLSMTIRKGEETKRPDFFGVDIEKLARSKRLI